MTSCSGRVARATLAVLLSCALGCATTNGGQSSVAAGVPDVPIPECSPEAKAAKVVECSAQAPCVSGFGMPLAALACFNTKGVCCERCQRKLVELKPATPLVVVIVTAAITAAAAGYAGYRIGLIVAPR